MLLGDHKNLHITNARGKKIKKIQGLFPQTCFYRVHLTQLTPKLTITWTNL